MQANEIWEIEVIYRISNATMHPTREYFEDAISWYVDDNILTIDMPKGVSYHIPMDIVLRVRTRDLENET